MVDVGSGEAFLKELMRLWQVGRYNELIDRIESLTDHENTMYTAAFHIASLHRLGRIKDMRRVVKKFDALAHQYPWDRMLLHLAAGDVHLGHALVRAETPRQAKRAMAYESVRLMSEGRFAEGAAWRHAANAPTTPTFERDLILADLCRDDLDPEELANWSLQRAADAYDLESYDASHEAALIAYKQKQRGASRVTYAQSLRALARIHKLRDEFGAARAFVEDAATILRLQLTEDDPLAFDALLEWAKELNSSGRWSDSLELWHTLKENPLVGGMEDDDVNAIRRGLADALSGTDHLDEAAELWQEILQDDDPAKKGWDMYHLSHVYLRQERNEDAIKVLKEAHPLRLQDNTWGAMSFFDLARAHEANGQHEVAEKRIQDGLAFIQERYSKQPGKKAQQLRLAGSAVRFAGLRERAIDIYQQALEVQVTKRDHWDRLMSLHDCGRLVWEAGRCDEADDLLSEAHHIATSKGENGAYYARKLEGLLADLRAGKEPPVEEQP